MPIRMSCRNIVLCMAFVFWAACNNDSSSNTAIEVSAPDEVSSSSEVVTEISSSSKIQENSSSSVASSSSEISSSSGVNADYPYTLWLHPSVHCWDTTYMNQVSCSSFRPEPQMDKPNSQASPPIDGRSMPSYCMQMYISVYVCQDGMKYPTDKFSLVGDTIVQCSVDKLDGRCVPANDACAKKIKDAETSTEYPYVLKNDTTVNCKEMYKMKMEKESIPYGTSYGGYEWVRCISYYLCEDGKSYEYEDMLQGE